MYGLINSAIRALVISKHGAEQWERVRTSSGLASDTFNTMDAYPDEMTGRLVGTAASVLGIEADSFMEDLGDFWVSYTSTQGYGPLLEACGESLREALFSLDALHARVGRSFPKLIPPSFRCETIDEQLLRMHYYTRRRGMCPMIPGLLNGLARHFGSTLSIRHDTCVREGADHCEFILQLHSDNT
jgi:hypothetical protein